MKVKVGQLKARLSEYLRGLEASGEPLEVCVRDEPVAYLTPVSKEGAGMDEAGEVAARLKAHGLAVQPSKRPKGKWKPVPGLAEEGRKIKKWCACLKLTSRRACYAEIPSQLRWHAEH